MKTNMDIRIASSMAILLLALAAPHPLSADVLVLKNGNRFEGKIVDETPDKVVVEMQYGTMEFKRRNIKEIIRKAAPVVPKPAPKPKPEPQAEDKPEKGPKAEPDKAKPGRRPRTQARGPAPLAFVKGEPRSGKDRLAGNNIYAANADGTGMRQVTKHEVKRRQKCDIAHLSWSPDGKKMAYLVTVVIGGDIWVVDVESGTGNMIKKSETFKMEVSEPAWSPDGKQIAFVGGARMFEKDIYVMAPTGGEAKKITSIGGHITSPVWSPDGRQIAFLSKPGRSDGGGGKTYDQPEICVVSVRDSRVRALVKGKGDRGEIAWSPDGKAIAFTSAPVAEKKGNATILGPPEIHVVTVATASRRHD